MESGGRYSSIDNSRCKDPEAEACFRNSKEARGTKMGEVRVGRGRDGEAGGQILQGLVGHRLDFTFYPM